MILWKKWSVRLLNIDDIIKSIDCCSSIICNCKKCPMYILAGTNCNSSILARYIRNSIDNQKKENDELTYKLWGVMHSVDKWLDDKELEQDEVNRAITMREKTLQITEGLQSEIRYLKDENEKAISYINELKQRIIEKDFEIDRLHTSIEVTKQEYDSMFRANKNLLAEVDRLNAQIKRLYKEIEYVALKTVETDESR